MTTTKAKFAPGTVAEFDRISTVYQCGCICDATGGSNKIFLCHKHAAAPDLYAALAGTRCGTCGYVISGPGIEVLHGGSCSACKPARAALAKARGE